MVVLTRTRDSLRSPWRPPKVNRDRSWPKYNEVLGVSFCCLRGISATLKECPIVLEIVNLSYGVIIVSISNFNEQFALWRISLPLDFNSFFSCYFCTFFFFMYIFVLYSVVVWSGHCVLSFVITRIRQRATAYILFCLWPSHLVNICTVTTYYTTPSVCSLFLHDSMTISLYFLQLLLNRKGVSGFFFFFFFGSHYCEFHSTTRCHSFQFLICLHFSLLLLLLLLVDSLRWFRNGGKNSCVCPSGSASLFPSGPRHRDMKTTVFIVMSRRLTLFCSCCVERGWPPPVTTSLQLIPAVAVAVVGYKFYLARNNFEFLLPTTVSTWRGAC